jgi:predicted permease
MRWWQLKKRDDDLARELETDLELEEEELRENGLPPEEAHYAARRAFGNTILVKEHIHEAWGWAPFEHLGQDLRFALRQFWRNKRFTAVCIATLALGIGAQTTIYSIIHAVLIDPFPYRDAMRMVHLHLYDKEPGNTDLALNGAQFASFEKSPVLDGALADDRYTMSLTGGDLPEQLAVSRMSSNAFEYFGVPTLLGRGFNASDGQRVAVLSYHLWKSHYAGRADAIGKLLKLNGENYAIIGVVPKRFAWMDADIYVPIPYSTDPGWIASVYARVRQGMSDRAAEQALQPMLDAFAKETPGSFPQAFKVHLVHINDLAIGEFRGVLVFVFISVSFLLVLACANVAILFLARGEARQTEIAMRKALGAGSRRIILQLLLESLLLSTAGGALGVLLAFAGVRALTHSPRPLPFYFPSEADIAVNIPVLLFSLCVSMLTGILCGLWPAFCVSRTGLRRTVDNGTHKLAGRRGTRRSQLILLTAQVAATMLLLLCSGATLRRLNELVHKSLGYDPQNVASLFLVLREHAHDDWADRVRYFDQIRAAIAADRSIVSASIGEPPPDSSRAIPLNVPGQAGEPREAVEEAVSEDYFSTLRIPVLTGRVWTRDESRRAAHLALINDAMRRRYWSNASPIGAAVVLNKGVAERTEWKLVAPGDDQHFQIIGVVGNVPNHGIEEEAAPAVYVPYSMEPYDGFNLIFRSQGDPVGVLHAIKERVRTIEADQAVGELVTATGLLEQGSIGRERSVAGAFAAFAFLALAFAVSGIYCIQSYLVAERTRELGVRIALGARRAHIIEEVTRPSVLAVLSGTAIGALAGFTGSRFLTQWTNGDASNPEILVVVFAALFFAALAASVGPALAATSIDPVRALRNE